MARKLKLKPQTFKQDSGESPHSRNAPSFARAFLSAEKLSGRPHAAVLIENVIYNLTFSTN